MKTLFLDRDGIINEDTGYAFKRDDIKFNPEAFRLMLQAQAKGYQIIIVTNQSGIAYGKYTEKDVKDLHMWMRGIFFSQGIKVKDFFICPYHPNGTVEEYTKDSLDRKPNPGMILAALEKHGGTIEESIMIGDKPSDRIQLDGLRSVILRSQYSNGDHDIVSLREVEPML